MKSIESNPSINSTRDPSVDLIKIIAMSLAVSLHVTRTAYAPGYEWIAQGIYSCGIVVIPLFFMVSGYLLLGRSNVTYRYSFKKIFNILRFIVIFGVLEWIVFYMRSMTVADLLSDLVSAARMSGTFWILWFMYALSIIYLVYPVLNRLYAHWSWYLLVLTSVLIIQNCAFISNLIGEGETGVRQTFRVWNWISYFMLGGVARRIRLDRLQLWACTLLSVMATVGMVRWLQPHIAHGDYGLFYSSTAVVALTFSIFKLIKSFPVKKSRLISECSLLFLPVYVLHLTVRDFLITNIPGFVPWCRSFPVGCILFWLSILIATSLVSYVIMKTPYLNRIFRL